MKPITAIRGLPFVVGLLNLDLNLSIAVILPVSNALTKSFLFDTIYPNLNRLTFEPQLDVCDINISIASQRNYISRKRGMHGVLFSTQLLVN